jgi:hypothetical protein
MRGKGSKRKATRKAGVRAGLRSALPRTDYFPTEDPDVFIACDYNPNTGAYDLNCRMISREQVPKEYLSNVTKGHRSGTWRIGSGGRLRKMKGAKKAVPKKAARKSTPRKAAKKSASKTPRRQSLSGIMLGQYGAFGGGLGRSMLRHRGGTAGGAFGGGLGGPPFRKMKGAKKSAAKKAAKKSAPKKAAKKPARRARRETAAGAMGFELGGSGRRPRKMKGAKKSAAKKAAKKSAPKKAAKKSASNTPRRRTAVRIAASEDFGFVYEGKGGFPEQQSLKVEAVGSGKVFRIEPREFWEQAKDEAASNASSLVPTTERQINIWIGDGDVALKHALKIGQTYRINFMVGQPISGSITYGAMAAVSSRDVPEGGLPTDWLVVARGAELTAGTSDTEVSVGAVGGVPIWSARFKLLIPVEGDSSKPQLKIRPLQAAPTIDVVVNARKEEGFPRFNEIYRQFKIALDAADRPGDSVVKPVRVTDELMPTETAHVGLRTTHEWTTPNGILSLTVLGSQAVVQGIAGLEQIDAVEPWVGVHALVSGRIKNVRDAAEAMRATWETHLNDIDPNDLADRLNRWAKRDGGPEYNWSSLGNFADAPHREQWDKMAASTELRTFAQQGRQLFQAFFPRASNLNKWIGALGPGARLNISWTPKAGAGFIPHVPWGLLYTADVPPEGQPVDPMGFLGLRCRIAYTSHAASPASRALGALDATHRAHYLYWGDRPNDVTGREAYWQRRQWGAWPNQIFVPQTPQNAKIELLKLLNDPQPSPTSVLYMFCQCNTGAGNNPILRFGSTNDPANVITQLDFGTASLADRPLVFANACTTVAADPYMANELEEAFFDRDCRAFVGTETKVPIVFASRFAEIFFQFFYRLLDESPMAGGEALAQTRLFLWTHYRNIGGLFYSYVNQYDLFVAREDEVLALRG